VRTAVDNFGSDASSLNALADRPVDIFKIDGSVISGQASTAHSKPLLESIFGIAHNLSLAVIAEGIEETDQLSLLHQLGCSMEQDYLRAWPAPERARGTVSRKWSTPARTLHPS